jgi:hypothetical protein
LQFNLVKGAALEVDSESQGAAVQEKISQEYSRCEQKGRYEKNYFPSL